MAMKDYCVERTSTEGFRFLVTLGYGNQSIAVFLIESLKKLPKLISSETKELLEINEGRKKNKLPQHKEAPTVLSICELL